MKRTGFGVEQENTDPYAGEMGPIQLARFERVAKNLIKRGIKMEFSDGTHGVLYVAHGLNAEGKIVGTWASRGRGKTALEFDPGTPPRTVAAALQYLADEFIKDLVDRDMIDA